MRTEKNLQNYLLRTARALGIMAHKMESKSSRGWPDVILIYKGRVVFVEVKSPKGTGVLSKMQRLIIDELQTQGAYVSIIQTREEADYVLEQISNPSSVTSCSHSIY